MLTINEQSKHTCYVNEEGIMRLFSESFYTDDFDQEMLDFIISAGMKVEGAAWGAPPALTDTHLRYGTENNYFWTTSYQPSYDRYVTKAQFKEKIGMTNKLGDYKIDVRDMSEEQKKKVQDAFFKMGYGWSKQCGICYRYLNAGFYYAGTFVQSQLEYDPVECEDYFKRNTTKQITYEELMKMANMQTFTKDDLKTGMILVFKNNETAMVLLDTANGDIVSGENWFPLKDFSDEELFTEGTSMRSGGVAAVYQPVCNVDFNLAKFDHKSKNYKQIWKREEKSQSQIELEKLQQQITELQKQADKIKATM
jgi:hypothetical protein